MKKREGAAATLRGLKVPPESEWPALYEERLANDTLPFPLGDLLQRLYAVRDLPADFINVARWYHEVTYRFLVAIVAGPLLKKGEPVGKLAESFQQVMSSERGLSMGVWADLAASGISLALRTPKVASDMPPFVFELSADLSALRRGFRAAVEFRNQAYHEAADGPVTVADARLYERSVIYSLVMLEPADNYELLLHQPSRRISGAGAVTATPAVPGGRPQAVELALWRGGKLRRRSRLDPWLLIDQVGGVSRALLLNSFDNDGTAHYQVAARRLASDEQLITLSKGPAVDALVKQRKRLGAPKSEPARDRIERWLPRLAEHFGDHARVLGVLDELPRVQDMGVLDPGEELAAAAPEYNPEFHDSHAVLTHVPVVRDGRCALYAESTWYNTIQALRAAGQRPPIISSSGVLVSPENRCVVLHLRSEKSSTYPNCLHTLGGAYMPIGKGYRGRDWDLARTLLREVDEESGENTNPSNLPMVLCDEPPTGFVQCVFLGVWTEMARMKPDWWEGKATAIDFDGLEGWLMQARKWVPSGKLHVMLWLAAGAPGCRDPRFAGKTAEELLEDVLEHSATDYAPPTIQPDC